MNEEIKRLEKRLKELKKKALRLQSESGCISCDLAVASSIIAQIYKDKEEGEKKRKLYLEGKITLGELFEGVDVNEDNKAAVEFIRNRFKYAMDLYFTDLD